MSKIYVIGAGNTELSTIRALAKVPEDSELILIDKISDLPDGVKLVINAREYKPEPFDPEPFILTAPKRFEDTYFPEKRKSHERPYKFHR